MIVKTREQLNQALELVKSKSTLMLEAGKVVDLEVTEFKKKRTNQANAYYWLFNGWVAEFLNDAGLSYGEHELPYTSELIHEIQKKIFGVESTAKMNIGDFNNYINRITVFWQEKTAGEFMPKELPLSYLEKQGYDFERNAR